MTRKQPAPVLAHGLPVAYYVSDDQYVNGPFVRLSDADGWAESHHTTGVLRFFSLGPLQQIGTMDRADSVGTVIKVE